MIVMHVFNYLWYIFVLFLLSKCCKKPKKIHLHIDRIFRLRVSAMILKINKKAKTVIYAYKPIGYYCVENYRIGIKLPLQKQFLSKWVDIFCLGNRKLTNKLFSFTKIVYQGSTKVIIRKYISCNWKGLFSVWSKKRRKSTEL